MIIYIFTAVVTFFFVMFLFKFYDFCNCVSRTVVTAKAIIIDQSVDEMCNKAVIIAEYQSHGQKLTDAKRQVWSLDTACAIMADVLLQHGLPAKDYNLVGLITVAQHRAGIIALTQFEEKECLKQEAHLDQ